MKKMMVLSMLAVFFVIVQVSVCDAGKSPLGIINVKAKLDYIVFSDDFLEEYQVNDGVFVGASLYSIFLPYFYFGMETGYAQPDGKVRNLDTELTYIPIEFNAMIAMNPSKYMVIDFGGGVGINYAKFEVSGMTTSFSEDDWLWGGQIFADLNYTRGLFCAGLNIKIQAAENGLKDYDVSLDNLRIGGHFGINF